MPVAALRNAPGCEVRGYPYWKSLTTGKSVALGGVPHDTYGMTTQSETWPNEAMAWRL